MSQKNPTSSKKPQGRNIKLSDGTIARVTDNQKQAVKKGEIKKHIIPKKPFSTETGKTNDEWEVSDDLDQLDYPPPSKHPLFRKFWAESIENITERKNFQTSHLDLFEALCRLKVELRSLDDFIMANGHTFRISTVLGDQRKTYPELTQRNVVLGHIAKFSTLLDLVPKKDNSKGGGKPSEEEEWE